MLSNREFITRRISFLAAREKRTTFLAYGRAQVAITHKLSGFVVVPKGP
jgi:hypothetical protein